MASGGGDCEHETDVEDTLPEPIYMRLGRQYRESYYDADDDESGDEEVSEAQIDLDLTAPPPDSWYHGRISRPTACERLEMVGMPGAYLVRESIGQPGDYAISYLSKTGHVHHFKINSNCGDYYIGGRQFFSLGDLIGFYANCSCILENESLEVPVVPPKPIPLYIMLRSTAPHTKTPGTDELSIVPGEVFVLLSRLNDDWGWGRSQRTGESGLIPIVIMEDLPNVDPNFGMPWYHGNIDRDEAQELLQRQGDVRSFLVRLSRPRNDQDGETKYSLAVKTPERVQKFLITKYETGYYVFGGRPFNTIEDIIERYRNEVILDGLTLGAPVPKEPVPLRATNQALIEPPHPMRNRANSTTISHTDMPGDKTGKLLLRKGKKSPVYGKWKEFYFVAKFKEQKLLYYDHESSHRAKGLLDLRQCKVYAVHPSLYGRSDVFVVMLRYLNELSFYYIAAENAQDWLRLLQQCTAADLHLQQRLLEVQQIRSLSLSMRDCKLAKGGPRSAISGLVSIDGACIARTRVASEVPYVFDQNFHFEDLPPYAQTFSVEVNAAKAKGISSMLGRDITFGRVNVHLSDLPNGQEDDQWHQLLIAGARTARGSLRLVANFKHEIILPLEEYNKLKELILGDDDLSVIEALAKVCKDHHAELASTLIHTFCHYNRVIPIMTACITKSIRNEENVATLFRASTLSTMLMDQFMKLTASEYLHSMLKGPIQQILESPESCELNPSNLPKGADLSQNLDRLETHLQHLLTTIFNSTDRCPPTLRYIFMSIQQEVIKKWPTDETVRTRAVSGFLFLRFICPALLKPQLFNLISETPSLVADRTLKLVTKAVQNLANLVEFRAKEPFMVSLNDFIRRHLPKMKQFINDISSYGQGLPPATLESSDPGRDLASIYHLCCTYEKSLQQQIQKQPNLKKLLGVMQSLRSAEKKHLNPKSFTPQSRAIDA